MATKLSKAQRRLLEGAERCRERKLDGVVAPGAKGRAVRVLERLGLVRFVGWGTSEDDPEPIDRPIYAITAKGIRTLSARSPASGKGDGR